MVRNRIVLSCGTCGNRTDALINTRRESAKLCRNCFGKRKDLRKNMLNNLKGKEWAGSSKSVESYAGTRTAKQRYHGACFPISLVEQQIKIYTKKGQTVLDPFMGVGTTSEASQNLGRKSIGIEINKRFVKLTLKDIKNKKNHKIIHDDVRNLLKHVKPNSVDFLITSPPYGTLLKNVKGEFAFKWKEHSTLNSVRNPKPYSRNRKDLGNLEYGDFLEEIKNVFKNTFVALKDGSYSVWVIKDYRDLKNKRPLVNLHSDIIKIAESSGFTLWDIKIYDQTKFRPLVVLGYPSDNYYLNIGHSYIIVFRKYVNGKYAKNSQTSS